MKQKPFALKKILSSSRLIVLAGLLMIASVFGNKTVQQAVAEDYSAKIAQLQEQIASSQGEANRLKEQGDSLQAALNALTAEKNAIQGQIELSQAKYDQLVAEIAANEKKMGDQQKVMANAISDLASETTTSPIELLAGSNSIGDYLDQQEYSSSIRDQLETSISMIKKLKAQLAEQKTEVERVMAQQKAQRDQLASKEAEQANLVAQTRGQESEYRNLTASLENQKKEAEAALARSLMSRSYANAAPAGYVSAGAVVGPVGSTGMSTGPHLHLEVRTGGGVTNPNPFIETEPVYGGYVSQSYGNPDPIYASGYHPGIDYAASTGTPIYAIKAGNMYRGCSQSLLGTWAYGYVAIVEHNDGSRAIYAHMNGPC